MPSYFPLDREILTSSIWTTGTSDALKVWIYLMLSANPRDGIVTDTVPAIAQRCGLPVITVEEVLNWLSEPDPYSRTADHDGRRIARTPEGIRLLTYLEHRDRDYSTPRVRAFRERQRRKKSEGETVKRRFTVSETTDTDTDKDTDLSKSVSAVHEDPHTSQNPELTDSQRDSPGRVGWDSHRGELRVTDELWGAICAEYGDIHEQDLGGIVDRLSRWLAAHPDQLVRYADELEPWLLAKLREDCERIRRVVRRREGSPT